MNNIFKNVKVLCTMIIAVVIFTSCGNYTTNSNSNTSKVICEQFIVVNESKYDTDFGTLYTVYDKDTKVMYYIMDAYYYHQAVMTPIYNSDGTVRIYNSEVE